MHKFYNGLSDSARTINDASAGGALMTKTIDQAYDTLEDTTTNSNQWPRDRSAVTPIFKHISFKPFQICGSIFVHYSRPINI